MARMLYISVFCAIFFLNCSIAEELQQCVKQDACHCQIDDFSRIDISKLSEDVLKDSDKNMTYFFYGCTDVTKEGSFFGAIKDNKTYSGSLFVFNETSKNVAVLGNTSIMQFDFMKDENIFQIIYKDHNTLNSYLTLSCDHINPTYIKVLDVKSNRLVLSSPKVCIIKEPHKTSTGSILVIIFIISCMIYFIGGACGLYFLRGARGVELIPNVEFWSSLPGLIRDGTIFILSGCRPNVVSTAETYDRI